MPIYPNAIFKPLPETHFQARLNPTIAVLHSAVSKTTSLFGYFRRADVVVESHFYIREDGTVEQYMDTNVRADAQVEGNDNCVSIETWDGGKPDTTPWNSKQINAIVELLRWLSKVHPIPLIKATGPNGKGIGYHTQFVPEWAGDHRTCPGRVRIPQVSQIIALAAREPVSKPASKPQPVKRFPSLRRGSMGSRVTALQRGLNRVFPSYSHLAVDSHYGPATEHVVMEFQRRAGLKSDGVVGPLTTAALARFGVRL